jgi:hypothetical protein
MRSIHRIAVLAATLALATPVLPVAAQTAPTKQQQQEAAVHFKKGLELFKDGDYPAALIEFRRAFELAPNYNVLYNIGQVYFQLSDYPNALDALERYLSEGVNKIPSSRGAEVLRDIEKLKGRIATIEFVTTVPDAEISVDDVVIGKTPIARPIRVSLGKRKISITKTGFTPTLKVVELAGGDFSKVAIDPTEIPIAPPVPTTPATTTTTAGDNRPPPLPPPPPAEPERPVPVAGIVVTSVLVVGAGVMGGLAMSAKSSLSDEVKSPTATRDSLDSAKGKATGFGAATDILIGSALISAGVTLYLGLRTPAKKDAAPAPGTPAFLRPTVHVGVGPGSLSLYGKF